MAGALTGAVRFFTELDPRLSLLVFGFLFLGIQLILLYGTFESSASIFGPIYWHGPKTLHAIALTFDDGPNEPHTSRILDILKEHNVKATFFVVGKNAERGADVVQRMLREGHEVGNHGYSHQAIVLKSPRTIREEIRRTSDLLERLTGVRPKLFRSPHGWRNPWLHHSVVEEGYTPVAWTYGVWDFKRSGVDMIVRRTINKLRNGSILLFHDGHKTEIAWDAGQLVEALPKIIGDCKQAGFGFVTLSQMIESRTI